MKNYIIYTDYDTFVIRNSLKEAVRVIQKTYFSVADFLKDSHIYLQNEDDSKENVKIDHLIRKVELTPEKLKEIEDKIDAEIFRTKECIKDMLITGWFGITEKDKPRALEKAVQQASCIWDEEKINDLP